MFENMDSSHAIALDDILRARHTVRSFAPDALEKEKVDRIIGAGLVAPFAMMAVIGKPDYRKFFIIPADSPTRAQIKDLILGRFPAYADEIEKKAGPVPFVKMLKSNGANLIKDGLSKPCLVIAAERWGIPAIAPESLSFSLENMWLKATTLGIGFQLLSVISGMMLGNDKEFCEILGIPCGEYYLDGFILGYPAKVYKPAPVKYSDFETSVRWF